MPFFVNCPHCKTKYRLKDHRKGHKVQCKNCGNAFRAGPKSARQSNVRLDEQNAGEKSASSSTSRPAKAPVPAVKASVPAVKVPEAIVPAKPASPIVASAPVVKAVPAVPQVPVVPPAPVVPQAIASPQTSAVPQSPVVSQASVVPQDASNPPAVVVPQETPAATLPSATPSPVVTAKPLVEPPTVTAQPLQATEPLIPELQGPNDEDLDELFSDLPDDDPESADPPKSEEDDQDSFEAEFNSGEFASEALTVSDSSNEDSLQSKSESNFEFEEDDEDALIRGVNEEQEVEVTTRFAADEAEFTDEPAEELALMPIDDEPVTPVNLANAPGVSTPSSAEVTPVATPIPPVAPANYQPNAASFAPVHPTTSTPTPVPQQPAAVTPTPNIPLTPPSGPNIVLPKVDPNSSVPTYPVSAQPVQAQPVQATIPVAVTPISPAPVVPPAPQPPKPNPPVQPVQPVAPVAPPPQQIQAPLVTPPSGPTNLAGVPISQTTPKKKTRREKLAQSKPVRSVGDSEHSFGQLIRIAIGIGAILLGIGLTWASFHSENQGGVVFFGLVIYGVLQIVYALSDDE